MASGTLAVGLADLNRWLRLRSKFMQPSEYGGFATAKYTVQ
jgi:hypothetical protein